MNRTRSLILASALAVAGGVGATVLLVDGGDDDERAVVEQDTTELADGEHVGRVDAAYVAPGELVFRPVQFFVGEAAQRAAAEDGAEAFDFYIREGSATPVVLPVGERVAVTAVDCSAACVEGAASDYDALTRSADGDDLHRVVVREGAVVAVHQLYLP